MKYLLDTHTLNWAISDVKKLSTASDKIISITNNLCYVSICSFWELSIKYALGKIEIKNDFKYYFKTTKQTGFKILGIKENHLIHLSKLDFIHNDPFDRLIVAQAIDDDLVLITKDIVLKEYPVKTLWK